MDGAGVTGNDVAEGIFREHREAEWIAGGGGARRGDHEVVGGGDRQAGLIGRDSTLRGGDESAAAGKALGLALRAGRVTD